MTPRARKRAAVGCVLVVLGTLLLASAAIAERAVLGDLEVAVDGRIEPYRLPRTGTAPVSIFISGHLATTDHTTPPQLQRMTIKLNRHGVLDSTGMPACHIEQIQPASTALAVSNCRRSLIGAGQFWAQVVFPDQLPYTTQGRLLAFNGRETSCPEVQRKDSPSPAQRSGRVWPSMPRTQGAPRARSEQASRSDSSRRERSAVVVRALHASDRGRRQAQCHTRPVVFVHVFTTHPFEDSFVITFAIRHIHQGHYGTELSASLPEALGSWGYLNRIKMILSHKYRYRGRQRSYFNAGCPAARGFNTANFQLAKASFYFSEGKTLSTTLTRPCAVSR